MSRTVVVPPIDLVRLAADTAAVACLREVVRTLRLRGVATRHSPSGALERCVRGEIVMRDELVGEIGGDRVDTLAVGGALVLADELVVPAIGLAFIGQVAIVVPCTQHGDADMVYVGCEAPWLIRTAWRVGPPGGSAADLATGTGIVAAVLSARYRHVVATDLSPDAVACAALTLALNQAPGRITEARVADVASGLEAGAFDLVVANPPWVPSSERMSGVLYADGGRSGMELPRRFIDATRSLLAPQGVGVIAVLDSEWSDGSRPLQVVLDELRGDGWEVTSEPAPSDVWTAEYEQDLHDLRPDCVRAGLVALVLRRPCSVRGGPAVLTLTSQGRDGSLGPHDR